MLNKKTSFSPNDKFISKGLSFLGGYYPFSKLSRIINIESLNKVLSIETYSYPPHAVAIISSEIKEKDTFSVAEEYVFNHAITPCDLLSEVF